MAMHRATGIAIPFWVVTAYYVGIYLLGKLLIFLFPDVRDALPVGGIDHVLGASSSSFSEVIESAPSIALDNFGTLSFAIFLSIVLMVPLSWVYVLTHRTKDVQASFIQTMIMLPIIVAGIAMIVQNSLALAFSLAGIVAAVRFRFSLKQPAHTLYIFAAITVGLSAGIRAIEVGAIVSIIFVYVAMMLWKLDYGSYLDGGFLAFISGRRSDD